MTLSSKSILLEDYSSVWKEQFDQLSKIYAERLAGLTIAVEHVGSTSVPGLCAKPVIDIDIVIDSVFQLEKIIPILVGLGYEYLGEVAIPDRFVFRPPSTAVPEDGSGRSWQKHHLYCCIKGSAALRNHLLLREALRKDDSLMNEYAVLKRSLAGTAIQMDDYVIGKTDFIIKILAEQGMSNEELLAIVAQNKSVIPPKVY